MTASQSILVVAPHADDELLALHRMMQLWVAQGHSVLVLYMTSNGVREQEAASYIESEQPGVSYDFARFDDTQLFLRLPAVVNTIRQTVLLHDIDLVIAPHWQEPVSITSDHLACYIAAQFVEVRKQYYMIWGHVRKGNVPAPRNKWRAFKWLLRSLLPMPKVEFALQLGSATQHTKAECLYKYYVSQRHLPPAIVDHACKQETLYR